MIHYGDITKISGYDVPIADCVIGGSPCQDLSVAGKRAGLDGERSGLFMEQIRITKEMRENDRRNNGRSGEHIRPRFLLWENVPGALSSNRGEDFRIVLEEIAKVVEKDAIIPMPEKNKWTTSGCIVGDGWTIAWRILDAQFWGVPQRRRRIALIADFGGHSASEILFVRKSVSGHTESSQQKRKEAPCDATRGVGADDKADGLILFEPRSQDGVPRVHGEQSPTLNTAQGGQRQPCVAYTLKIRSGVSVDSYGKAAGKGALIQEDKSATLGVSQDQYPFQPIIALDRASFNQGKNAQFDFEVTDKGINSPIVAKGPSAVCYTTAYGFDQSAVRDMGKLFLEEKSKTITNGTSPGHHNGGVVKYIDTTHADDVARIDDTVSPLQARDYKGGKLVAQAVDCRNCTEDDINGSLQSNSAHSLNGNNVVRTRYIVRRLTPLECERLQGYPDGWTDIGEYIDSNGKKKQSSDAARYKALGNSIALPPWKWVLKRLCSCYERDATMASLFDGLGGFPYLWEQINGKGTCLWASEIEEFPIAVTKARIGE